ncbi:MAG: hypothetical protein DMG05_13850 [Acidobacteria bacterium]|nr:MAG: hypothetical protein DMG05_13850 [Acidobacteriota bacterium]
MNGPVGSSLSRGTQFLQSFPPGGNFKGVISMAFSRPGEKRHAQRFQIECPVSIEIPRPRKGLGLEEGKLRDIGVGGARFYLDRSLGVGTRVILDVHLPRASKEGVTTVRFKAIVMRELQGPSYQIAVRFRQGGQFLRRGLDELIQGSAGT